MIVKFLRLSFLRLYHLYLLRLLSFESVAFYLQRSKFLHFAVYYNGIFLDRFYLDRFLALIASLCSCADVPLNTIQTNSAD